MVVESKKRAATKPSRGKFLRFSLYWAQIDPTRGSEIAKTRPVVVVSPDEMNLNLETVVICPLTSQLHPQWASRVPCRCGEVPSEIAVDQIRTVSKSRLGKLITRLNPAEIAELRRVMGLLYVAD